MYCHSVSINQTSHFDTYFLNNSREYNAGKKRPLVLVIPGGGYAFTSDREAEPIALKFNSIGCHSAVLWYSVYDQVSSVPGNSLIECLQAVAWCRKHADEYLIDPELIFVCGFSAGGNLALNAAVRWHESWLDEETGTTPEERKVNFCIDCYGALQFGKSQPGDYGFGTEMIEHPQSWNLRMFGSDNPADDEVRQINPLAHFNPEYVGPMFIWHNGEDQIVPVSQALLLAQTLAEGKVPFELIVFEKGEHGLALADRTTARKDSHKDVHTARWFELCSEWMAPYIDSRPEPYGKYPKGIPGRKGPGQL